MTDLRSKLNIHGIVDLDQMALVLTSLVEQVERQNHTIADLNNKFTLYVTKESFVERLESVENVLAGACTKIDAIQEAVTATAMGKRISAGNLATANFKHICNLTNLVMECATKVELEVQKKELSGVQFDLSELRSDYERSLGVLDNLSKSQYHQSERIGALESAVAGKIDRAECDHLQSLVAKVLLYDAFKADTIEALKRLHKFRDESLLRDEGFDGYLAALDKELKDAQGVLSRTATKKDTHQLAYELQDLERRLQDYARNDALLEVRNAGMRTDERLTSCDLEVKALQSTSTQLQSELTTKASVAAVRECVLRRHYQEAVSALGGELERKTAQSVTNALDARMQSVEERAAADRERLSVAMRFVEWFTSRGENYEHNIKIIDKHLKGLIVSPAPSQGTPASSAAVGAGVMLPGMGAVSPSVLGSSSSVHSYYLPGNRLSFHANPNHAP